MCCPLFHPTSLRLFDRPDLDPRYPSHMIDLLFESIAAAYSEKAIGVILTGSGSDGAIGIRAIKEKGGLTIVQDSQTAESTGMANAAIHTGAIDKVLPLHGIDDAIVQTVTEEEAHARD